LVTRTHCRSVRPAAVSASTVFAIALAIVAGLIFAWLFKAVLLDKKPPQKPVDDTEEITVAATNIYDQSEIKPSNIKRVRVPHKQADDLKKRGMLWGQKPVGRVTKKSINAEDPIFEEDLLPYKYPEPLDKLLAKGMRPVIITLGPRDAMVQVNDYVDVYCTMNTDEVLGPGANRTAQIAKGAKVIARFNTTRPGAQPANPKAPREYTLQVTPYRAALIELAKKDGATFAFVNSPTTTEGDQVKAPEPNDPEKEPPADLVTKDDLARLFHLEPPPDPGPGPWNIQKYVGIHNRGTTSFPGYIPPSRQGSGTPSTTTPTTPTSSGAESRAKSSKTVPVAYTPRTTPRTQSSFNPANAVASSSRKFGAPIDPNAKKGCSG
jgi:Flp pilus assembly protein CpaB